MRNPYQLGGQPVKHPSWCVPHLCTAPATYPTEYRGGGGQAHRSENLVSHAAVFEGDEVYLSQYAAAPWECNVFLNIKTADMGHGSRQMSVELETTSPLLWAILAHVHDLWKAYPTLIEAAGWAPPVPGPGAAGITSSDDVTPTEERRSSGPAAAEENAVDQTDGAALTLSAARTTLADWERKAEEAKASGDQAALAYRTARAEGMRKIIERLERDGDERFAREQAAAVIKGWTPKGAIAERKAREALPVLAVAVDAEPSKWWCTIYTSTTDSKTYISGPFLHFTEEDASALTAQSRLVQEVLNVAGPFFTETEAKAYREAWLHAAAYGQNRQLIAALAVIAHRHEAQPRPNASDVPHWIHSGPCIYCTHGPACVSCDLTQGPHWGVDRSYPGPVCSNCAEECKRREIAADPYYRGDYVEMFGDDE